MIEVYKGGAALEFFLDGADYETFLKLIEDLAQETYDTDSVALARRFWRMLSD